MYTLFNLFFLFCDAPRGWGVYLQESDSPQMEALVELHDNIMFYLVIVLFALTWILVSIFIYYVKRWSTTISKKDINLRTLIVLIWTISPALILILIALPSFKLLYLMDEVTDPSLTVFVEGHQWYWSYQDPDLLNEEDEDLDVYSDVLFSQPSQNLPSLKEIGLDQYLTTEQPPMPSRTLSETIMLRADKIYSDRLQTLNSEELPNQGAFKSLTTKDLGITMASPEGDILREAANHYIREKQLTGPSSNYSPLFKLCYGLSSAHSDNDWDIKTLFSKFTNHTSIKSDLVTELRNQGK